MSEQQITPELQQWIVDQAKAGRDPDAVLQSMIDSGWMEDVALVALEHTLTGFLKDHARANGLPEPVRIPEPVLNRKVSAVAIEGHEVKVLMSLHNPRVMVFGNLLTSAECDELVTLARARLTRSETVVSPGNDKGSTEINPMRTSDGMFFARGENAACARLEARIAALLNWPVENGEGLQVLRYRPGAEYKPHYDYFNPDQPGTPAILQHGGQRVGTLLVYLNTPHEGGATTFPDVQLEVMPVKGNAVFFSYDRPHPLTRTLHGGAPVLEGEKWVATKWLREGSFV